MITTDLANAEKFSAWIRDRGGIALWQAADFSGRSCFTPALTDGVPTRKPYWWCDDKPEEVITDPTTVRLQTSKEVKRFHIAVRLGANGLRVKVTDASSAKINKTLDALGGEAFYEFDYSTQEAVFYLPDTTTTLDEWEKRQP